MTSTLLYLMFLLSGKECIFMGRKKVDTHIVNGVAFESLVNYRLHTPINQMGGNRYWQGIFYPENMIPTWRDAIGSMCSLPLEAILHDKDLNKDGTRRKEHIHVIIAWNNTTGALSAFKTFSNLGMSLSANGVNTFALNTLEAVQNIGNAHNYMRHATDDAQKKCKHLYAEEELLSFNNFDIGLFEQLGVVEEEQIKTQIEAMILEGRIKNYLKLKLMVRQLKDTRYIKVLEKNIYEFSTLTRSMWQWEEEYRKEYGQGYEKEFEKELNAFTGEVISDKAEADTEATEEAK